MTGVDRIWVAVQTALLALLVLILVFLQRSTYSGAQNWLGAALGLLGLAVLVTAFVAHAMVNRTIEVNVSPAPNPDKKLVVRGIYAYVRHPFYLSAILAVAAFAVWHGTVPAIAGAVAIAVFYYFKSRYEDGLLQRAYPEYAEYKRRVGRLLPRPASFLRRN